MRIHIKNTSICDPDDLFYHKQFTHFPDGSVYSIINVKGVEHAISIIGYNGSVTVDVFIGEIELLLNK